MKSINKNILKSIKAVHVLMICFWLGAVASVVIIFFSTNEYSSKEIISNSTGLMENIDIYIIIPCSGICWFSGVLLSYFSNWGFVVHKWILVKLILGTLLILYGIFFLGPWVMESPTLLDSNYPEYLSVQKKLGISMTIQLIIIIFLTIISVVKPWGKLIMNKNNQK